MKNDIKAAAIAAGPAVLIKYMFSYGAEIEKRMAGRAAEMKVLFEKWHDSAKIKFAQYDLHELKKIDQTLEPMFKRVAFMMRAVENERGKEFVYNGMKLESPNDIGLVPPPYYEILKSVEDISQDEIDKSFIMIVATRFSLRCQIAEHEGIFPARPGEGYPGKILRVYEKTVIQEISPGVRVEYPRSALPHITKADEGKPFFIYYDKEGKAEARKVDLPPTEHFCIER